MPHASLKLRAGVDTNETPALNEAGVSSSQLIRYWPDAQQGAIIQKLGGWSQYYSNAMPSAVSALAAWADLNDRTYLGVGGATFLYTISSGSQRDITPRTDNTHSAVAVDVDTTAGSNVVTIHDTGSNITGYDTVYIKTQIAVGGLILFGLYKTIADSANQYEIEVFDNIGQPMPAVSTVTTGGATAEITTISGESLVTVTLAANGYVAGGVFTFLVPLTVGGITFAVGDYQIISITDADNFVIQGPNAATSSTSGFVNGGDADYEYFIGVGPLPAGSGFGVGGFGVGGFGSGIAPSANPGTPITATDWVLDNWGSILIALPEGEPLFEWNPIANEQIASVISDGPPANIAFFIAMPQRQIIALGSSFDGIVDHLLVRWCDINNFSIWKAFTTNQAGSYRLTRGSRIIGGIQGPQQGLIWTDVGLWTMQYVNQPDIWNFNEIAKGCGLIGKKAAGILGGIVYWMSPSNMWGLADGAQVIPCPVWDVFFQQVDATHFDKIRCCPNSQFNEISWHFPTIGSGGQNTMYIKYNALTKTWDFGPLTPSSNPSLGVRTAWVDYSVLGSPIGSASDNFIYQHETSNDAAGQAMLSSFTTGYFAMSEGDWKTFIDQWWPDFKWGLFNSSPTATIQITFYGVDYPGETPTVYGPFTVTQSTKFISPRVRKRLIAVKISSSDIGSFWRTGNNRYRGQPAGKYG